MPASGMPATASAPNPGNIAWRNNPSIISAIQPLTAFGDRVNAEPYAGATRRAL